MELQFNARLAAIADLVRPGSVVADIGADHGYLVCSLVGSGRCPKGFACDINSQPLERAEKTIRACGLETQVTTMLTNGLQGLPWQEIGDFVIAGMGGDLISEILAAATWSRQRGVDKHYILQPMTKAEHLRRWLYRQGYAIEREVAVVSGRFPYTVFLVTYSGECKAVTELFAWTGLLLEQRSEEAMAYLGRTLETVRKKVAGLERAKAADPQVLEEYRQIVLRLEEGQKR